ncbi:MAG: TonB-dependent receptor [Prevotella sp.]|nr:TonB-dependent receptor [Prevotella sp.]
MADALRELNTLQKRYTVNFIYDDLEDFRLTTEVRGKSVPDALQQIIGFYPITVTQKGDVLLVECTHKTERHLTGKIIDEQGEAVAFANVLLLSPTDSSVIAGGVSNESGVFVVPYEPAKVLAKISYVGYKTFYRIFTTEQAGTIRLQPETQTLTAVKVKALRPQYKMAKGGMSIDVENSVLSQVGTAQDVLGQLPRVSVDGSGGVSVFAKGNPEIYINNKLVRSNQDLVNLKSTDIKAVDVITSPGAQYNATVKSVIRIHTKKVQGDGFSYRADNNVKMNRRWSGFQEDYVKYRKNGLEVFADGYISTINNDETTHIWQDIQGTDHIHIDQNLLSEERSNYLHGKAGASYDFDSDNSVGLSYTIDKSFNKRGQAIGATQDIYRNGDLLGHVAQSVDQRGSEGPSHESNAYYIGKWGKLDIDLNATYVWNKTTQSMYETEESQQVESRAVNTYNAQHNRLWAGKLILSYPVWKGKLSWGTELSSTYSKGEYTNQEGYVKASLTEVKEKNTAGFAEYEFTVGRWNFDGGVRYEYVKSDYYSFGERQDGPSRRYGNWFPSFSASWQKDMLGLQLSYSYKTTRPNYNSLRDEVMYDNRFFYEGGNPYLVPTKIHSLDLGLTYSWLSVGAGYNYNKDNMEWCVTLYNDQSIGFLRDLNFDHSQSVYASIVASPKFGWYQPTAEVDYEQQFFNAKDYGGSRNLNRPGFRFSLRNRLVFPHDFTAMVNFQHSTVQYAGFIKNGSKSNLNVQFIKSFHNKLWTLNLRIYDILRTEKIKMDMYGISASLGKQAYDYDRRVSFTVTYNFNSTRSKYKGTGAGNAEKRRL